MAEQSSDRQRTVDRIAWRLDALDEWRKNIEGRVIVLESNVNDLRFTNEVAEALARKLDQKRELEITLRQKVGGGAFALLLVVIPIVAERLL